MKILKSRGINIFMMVVIYSSAYMGTIRTVSSEDIKVPPTPQFVTDTWMLIVGYEADPASIKLYFHLGLNLTLVIWSL